MTDTLARFVSGYVEKKVIFGDKYFHEIATCVFHVSIIAQICPKHEWNCWFQPFLRLTKYYFIVSKKRFSDKKTSVWSTTTAAAVILIGAVCLIGWMSLQSFTASSVSAATDIVQPVTNIVSDKQTVCLDPGHGGEDDPGAVNGDVVERDINLVVANKAKTLLELAGFRVVMTRTSNDNVLDNTARADYCNSQSADIVISIHHNDYTDNVTDYATALYYKSEDQELAQDILNATSTGLDVADNGLSTLEDNVLAKSEMPATLSEAFFVSSDTEKYQISQNGSSRLDDEAVALVSGIQKYFANQP